MGISIKYDLLSESVYNLFNARKIVKYYNIFQTNDIVDAAEIMMKSIKYDNRTLKRKFTKLLRDYY